METWTERAEEADRQAAALRRTVKYFRANPYEGSTPHVDALERRANRLDVDAAHYRRLAGLPPSVPGASGGELVSRDSSTVARVIRTSLESGHQVRLRVPQVRSVLDVVGVPEYRGSTSAGELFAVQARNPRSGKVRGFGLFPGREYRVIVSA